MNFAVLEKFISEGDLSRDAFQYLLNCRTECEWLDYKSELDLDSDIPLCEFARDVLAMKNVGGGYILIGVKDKTWEQIGLSKSWPYDTKMLRDKIVRATGVTLDIDVVQHDLLLPQGKVYFPLVFIRSSKKKSKRRSPTVVSKDFCYSKPYGLRKGEIYIRKGDSSSKITSQQDLEHALEQLDEQTMRDRLESDASPSPFAVDEGTFRLLDKGFDSFVGRVALRKQLLTAVTHDPRIWIINVHGPGGVGKSALVNWATYQFYQIGEFEAILQLTAKESVLTDQGIRAFSRSLYSLENLLDHVLALFQEPLTSELPTKKEKVIELLSAWKTLLVLDNMETVSDGRILSFIQNFPPTVKAKVLLTSRFKSGGWELPIAVSEFSPDEIKEFIGIKAAELGVAFPRDDATSRKVADVSGGLPLAIQWMIGQFKRTNRLDVVLARTKEKDSPVLEFSFRNIWNVLDSDARTVLAVLSIFDGPTTVQEIGIASELRLDVVERSLSNLSEVTLVTRSTQQSDGRVLFSSLPITMSFARHQLSEMGDLEIRARRRVRQFNEQMELQASEVARFRSEFERYGIASENDRRAAILCRRAQSEMFSGNVTEAELLFKQARDLAPTSAYVHAMTASFELRLGHIGKALETIAEACKRVTQKTGSLCYRIKAEIMDAQRDRSGRVEALAKAVSYDPHDPVLRHQYGVALSRAGKEADAVAQFTDIIEEEKKRSPPRDTLLAALTTRIINLQRLKRDDEAKADLRWGEQLLADFPALKARSGKFLELSADFAEPVHRSGK